MTNWSTRAHPCRPSESTSSFAAGSRGCSSGRRRSARRERLGITGWVKNRPDGNIEIVAEGEEDAIKEMVSWAHHGPSAARVDDVDVRWRGYTGEFSDFRITE